MMANTKSDIKLMKRVKEKDIVIKKFNNKLIMRKGLR